MRPLVLLALVGCTHQQHYSTLQNLPGKSVTVTTFSGEKREATVAVGPDRVNLVGLDGRAVSSLDVKEVVEVRRGRGALEGLGIGALIGGVVGAGIGYADGDDQCTDFCILVFSAEEKAVFSGIAFGVMGGLAGAVIGAIAGSRTVYTSGEVRVTPIGPPGSYAGATISF